MIERLLLVAVYVGIPVGGLGLLLLLLTCASPAHGQHNHAALPPWLLAHPSFPWCCSARDCEMLSVQPTPTTNGWVVRVGGKRYPAVPYDRTLESEDGRFYACIVPGQDTVRCLYSPPSGV